MGCGEFHCGGIAEDAIFLEMVTGRDGHKTSKKISSQLPVVGERQRAAKSNSVGEG
jgi:hypothetical protein